MRSRSWSQHISQVARTGWSVVGQISEPVLNNLTVPFQEPHEPGVFLDLNRKQARSLSPAVANFVSVIEQTSATTPYKKLRCSKVWFQESDSNTTRRAEHSVPFVPHIDGARYFKIMIYISDVGLTDGPMRIASQPPDVNEVLRCQFDRHYQKRGHNQMSEVLSEDLHALVGARGSAVLFDTNTPHTASQIEPDGLRRVVRFDFTCNRWDNTKVQGKHGWRNFTPNSLIRQR